jgi:hypothetical protein
MVQTRPNVDAGRDDDARERGKAMSQGDPLGQAIQDHAMGQSGILTGTSGANVMGYNTYVAGQGTGATRTGGPAQPYRMFGWLEAVHDAIPRGVWLALMVMGFVGGLWSWLALQGMPGTGADIAIALLWVLGCTVLPALALRLVFVALDVALKLAMVGLIMGAMGALVYGGMLALG